jgi:hypothetical protein
MNDLASDLFGDTERVKIVRLFATNTRRAFSTKLIVGKTRLSPQRVKNEVAELLKKGIIKKGDSESREQLFLYADGDHTTVCKLLFGKSLAANEEKRLSKLKQVGKLKLIATGGSFMGDDEASIDILIVGDVKVNLLERVLKQFEEEVGHDLSYMLLSEDQFRTRMDMRDRLVYNFFERPHTILFEKLKMTLPSVQ